MSAHHRKSAGSETKNGLNLVGSSRFSHFNPPGNSLVEISFGDYFPSVELFDKSGSFNRLAR